MALLLPYRVQFPPVKLIITSTSATKVTFTQTRAHKYLSVRTQTDDFFPAFVRLRHLSVEVSSWRQRGWHFGVWQDPLAYLAGERTGLCDKDTHTLAAQIKTEVRQMQIKGVQWNKHGNSDILVSSDIAPVTKAISSESRKHFKLSIAQYD